MKKVKYYLLFIIVFMFVSTNSVKGYKCTYSGQKVEGQWWDSIEGDIELEINNNIPLGTNINKVIIPAREVFSNLAKLVGREELAIGTHITPYLPLDYMVIQIEKDSKNNIKGLTVGNKNILTDAFNNEEVCPSEINIANALCFNATKITSPFATFETATTARSMMFYYLNADIFDDFYKSEDNYYMFYAPTSLLEYSETNDIGISKVVQKINNDIHSRKIDVCTFKYEDNSSAVWTLDESKSEGKKKSMIFDCNYFNQNWDRDQTKQLADDKSVSATYEKYQKCLKKNPKDKSKCSDELSYYNNSLLKVQTWCKSVVDNRSYNSSCLRRCAKLGEEIYKVTCDKDKNGNCVSNDGSDCNMSDTIISIVYNVLKWMKYIAPVLVIILSMIDFIKALASQDNDAMKKAQQKFVKRLVSAVILFLLPLIIDYVLRLFNLVDTKCDITNIFK